MHVGSVCVGVCVCVWVGGEVPRGRKGKDKTWRVTRIGRERQGEASLAGYLAATKWASSHSVSPQWLKLGARIRVRVRCEG
jgi:hypothetical protein